MFWKLKRERGFGLAEVMISLAIVLVMFSSLVSLIVTTVKYQSYIKKKFIAESLMMGIYSVITSIPTLYVMDPHTGDVIKASNIPNKHWYPLIISTNGGNKYTGIYADINGYRYTTYVWVTTQNTITKLDNDGSLNKTYTLPLDKPIYILNMVVEVENLHNSSEKYQYARTIRYFNP